MTKLLEEAFKRASELTEIEQDTLAKWLLEELKSEKCWERMYTESQDVLSRLADEALDAYKNGKTKPMDFDRL
jgi:hypothetical protein